MKRAKTTIIGNGADHHVKLGKESRVKAGPSYKHPGKANMAKDMYSNRKAESAT